MEMKKKKSSTYSSFKKKGVSYIKSKEQLKQESVFREISKIAEEALKELSPIPPKKRGRPNKIEISPEQQKILYEISKIAEEALKDSIFSQPLPETRGRKKKLSGIDRVKLRRSYRKLMKEISNSRVNGPVRKPWKIAMDLIAEQFGVSFETIRRLIYTHK